MGQAQRDISPPHEGQATHRFWSRILGNTHLWVVAALFAAAVVAQYPQQLHVTAAPSLFSFLGLSRHTFERILLLIPVGYAIAVFGLSAGFVSITVAGAVMLPGVFLFSQYPTDALLETIGILLVSSVANLWFHSYKREKEGWQRTASNLETAYQQLENRASTIEEHDKQLGVLNSITGTISQSLELNQILDRAVEGVSDLTKADGAWIYLISPDEPVLTLLAHCGLSEKLPSIRSGYGLSGRVAETGKAAVIQNPQKDGGASKTLAGEMRSVLIVPIRSKGELRGTLGISSHAHHTYEQRDINLLSAIADEIGIAVENARLYGKQQEVARELVRLNELKSDLLTQKTEQLQRISREVGRLEEEKRRFVNFLAVVAHDLKSPLSVSQAALWAILDGYYGPVGVEQKEMIERIGLRIESLATLVDDLIDIPLIETGQLVREMKEVSVLEAIHTCVDEFRLLAAEKGLWLETALPSRLPAVYGSARRISQVMNNLVSNAIKYSERGAITVRAEEEGSNIRIAVSDSGIGISPEDLPRLFEDFFRGENVGTNKGTGLGLSICRRIIAAHGGRIWAESPNPGTNTGSRFVFTLPTYTGSQPQIMDIQIQSELK